MPEFVELQDTGYLQVELCEWEDQIIWGPEEDNDVIMDIRYFSFIPSFSDTLTVYLIYL